MKKFLAGIILLASSLSYASIEGVYNGKTRSGDQCVLEILSFSEQDDDITVKFKTSMQAAPEFVYTGYGEIQGYAAGNVYGDYEADAIEEMVTLYIDINRSNNVKGIGTMAITRSVEGKRELDDVCTYLEQQ